MVISFSAMNRKWTALGVLFVAAILTSCEKPATPVAVADTREADAKAIRQLEENWAKAMSEKDAARFASNYAPDASVYVNGIPAMHGTEAILAGLKQAFADPNFSNSFKTAKVHVAKSGDMACSEGTYESTGTDPVSKKKVPEKGNYVTCWMKQADGNWKVVADINAAEPPAAK